MRFFFILIIRIILFIFPNFSIVFRWDSLIRFPNFTVFIRRVFLFFYCFRRLILIRSINLFDRNIHFQSFIINTFTWTMHILWNMIIFNFRNFHIINILWNILIWIFHSFWFANGIFYWGFQIIQFIIILHFYKFRFRILTRIILIILVILNFHKLGFGFFIRINITIISFNFHKLRFIFLWNVVFIDCFIWSCFFCFSFFEEFLWVKFTDINWLFQYISVIYFFHFNKVCRTNIFRIDFSCVFLFFTRFSFSFLFFTCYAQFFSFLFSFQSSFFSQSLLFFRSAFFFLTGFTNGIFNEVQ